MEDSFGNEMEVKVERKGNKIIHTKTYTLPKGKSTLKGGFSKFRADDACAFPDRLACNYGVGFERCKFMEFVSVGNWRCVFKKKKG